MKIDKLTKRSVQGVLGMVGTFFLGRTDLSLENIIIILCFIGVIGLSWFFQEK